MANQSKITVKHYLEKKGNYISFNGGKKGFPLYCQVTYKRKTTKFKSFTRAVMTEIGYNDYYQKNIINLDEVFIPNLDIEKEIKLIELSIKNITIGNIDLNVLEKSFLTSLKVYFEPISQRLIKTGWFFFHTLDLSEKPINSKKEAYTVDDILNFKPSNEEIRISTLYKSSDKTINHKRFYQTFNEENTLLENIYRINTILKIDIRPYFFNGTLMYWEIVELILIFYKGLTTIEFLERFNIEDLYEFSQKTKYTFIKTDFDKVCKKLIYSVLGTE